jgi:two-component system sensor histidine kinase DegS
MISKIADGSGVRIEGALDDLEQTWNAGNDIHIFRVIQECLNNVVKHAGARTAWVEATKVAHQLEIVIRDDGSGFDVAGESRRTRRGGRGLTSMKERINIVGGQMVINSSPGAGCTVCVTIPLALNTVPNPDPDLRR